MGRFQVTNSRSGVGINDTSVDQAAQLALQSGMVDGGSKKREISVLDTNIRTERTKAPPSSTAKRSRTDPTFMLSKATTSSVLKPQATSAATAVSSYAGLGSSMIVLNHVPVSVCAQDVVSTLFSGLSITAMFVCTRALKAEQLYSADTGEINPLAVVDVYVEFTSTSGAELALVRKGEQLQYRQAQVDASSSVKVSVPVRASMAPHMQAVGRELAFWVKLVGLKLSTTSSSSTSSSPLSTHSTIRKHMEVLGATLKLASSCSSGSDPAGNLAACTSISAADNSLLLDPISLLNHWHPVVSQLMLQHGVREIYDRDRERKVRISKSTKYMFFHPAVDDILFTPDFISNSTQLDIAPGEAPAIEPATSKGFIDDEGEGLYRAGDDDQLFQFQDFVSEAEDSVRKYTNLWSALVLQCEAAASTDKPTVKTSSEAAKLKDVPVVASQGVSAAYGVEYCYRRLVLSKVLYKEAWGLCTTHCVFED